jgi:hypothetical protein
VSSHAFAHADRTGQNDSAGKDEAPRPERRIAAETASPLSDMQLHAGNRAVNDLLRGGGGGRSLEPDTREEMEQRFAADFGSVRVHTDQVTQEMAATLSAKAYTVGNAIGFSGGRYAPHTHEGKRLLAHELAHVVQQSRGGVAPRAGAPNASLEHGADVAAAQVTAGGGPVSVAGASGVGVACDDDKERKRASSGVLPAGLEEDLQKKYGLPQQSDEDKQFAAIKDPKLREAAKAYFDKQKPKPTDADPFGLFGGKPPSWDTKQQGGTPFANDPFAASNQLLLPFQPWWNPDKKQPGTAQAKPKPPAKKPDPKPQPKQPAEEFGAPAWPDWSPELMDDDVLYAKRYEVAEWLSKHKTSSPTTVKYAELYRKLRRQAQEREAKRKLETGAVSAGEDNPRLQYLESEFEPLLNALPGAAGDTPVQPFTPASSDADAGKQQFTLPDEPDGSDIRSNPRYIDNFTAISMDIGAPNYVLTYSDGTTVSVPKALVEQLKQGKKETKAPPGAITVSINAYWARTPGKFENGIWVFAPEDKKGKAAAAANPVLMPQNFSKAEVPRLLAEIEKNKDVLETDELLHYTGREILTYEHVPGSETIGKIMFWTSVTGMGVRYSMSTGVLPKIMSGPRAPPPKGNLTFNVPEEYATPLGRPGNDNMWFTAEEVDAMLNRSPGSTPRVANDVFPPDTPFAMPRTGTGDFFYPQPAPNAPPSLWVVPKTSPQTFDFPWNAPVASGGGGKGSDIMIGGPTWGAFPGTDVSSTRIGAGAGTWQSQSLRQKKIEVKRSGIKAAIEAEIDRINSRRSEITDEEWKDQRAGLTKRLYNLREQDHALQIAQQDPNATVFSQVKVLGVQQAGGFKSTEEVAGSGRIPDIGLLKADSRTRLELLDSKTASEVVNSIKKRGAPGYRPSSPIGRQTAKEDALKAEGGDWILEGTDAITGERFIFKMAPADVERSRGVPYGQFEH